MKTFRVISFVAAALTGGPVMAADTYVNFIRQVQLDTGVEWDVQVGQTGTQLSALAINPGGARFELWTVLQSPYTTYLLDSKFVSTYVPQASVAIRTEDPFSEIPRTRADRPFAVDVTVNGLITDNPTAPIPSTRVKLLHYVQSYGASGTGVNLDRTQAILHGAGYVVTNGLHTLIYNSTTIPGTNLSKVRGEERFTVDSLADYQTPESALASLFLQIWPVADGSISGITMNQTIRFAMPQVTIQLNDLYPSSKTYAQVYPGAAQLGTSGVIVPGSAVLVNDTVPQNKTVTLSNWDAVITASGLWTMELITETPFGVERLAWVSFNVDRTIEVNGSVTTLE